MDIGDKLRLLELIVPRGSWLMLLGAYFDESESQGAPPNVITVAGYLMKDLQAKRMSREIARGHADFGIEFFHQCECALGVDQYAHLGKEGCIKAQDYLRAIIKRRTILGVGATIHVEEYLDTVGEGPGKPTPYAFAMLSAMNVIRGWINRTKFEGEIAYFFEDGYKDEGNGKRFIDYLLQLDEEKAGYRMVSFTHVNKRKLLPLQAADMLAWYTNQEFTRLKEGRGGRRKDFEALLRPQDRRLDHTWETLSQFGQVLDEYGRPVLME